MLCLRVQASLCNTGDVESQSQTVSGPEGQRAGGGGKGAVRNQACAQGISRASSRMLTCIQNS